jgi:arginine N-succinyltransferase
MYIVRSCKTEDLNDLFELSQLVFFINLPANKEQINKIIENSIKSFNNPSIHLEENNYLFVLEDLQKNKVIGASLIHAQHGTQDSPHFFLRVGREEKYSTTLHKKFTHNTLRLGLDIDGPTEIGGLVLHPDYRNNSQRLGKQLSYIRFLYMSYFPKNFKKIIHSELMPPLDKNGNSPIWEAIGRKFLDMDYITADKLSRKNKEFILSLYPSENIYETLLPQDAIDAIGQVGPNTVPAKNMLEKIGFKFTNEVDPFDGGPHYRALLSEITPVKNAFRGKLVLDKKLKQEKKPYLVLANNIPQITAIKVDGIENQNVLYFENDNLKNYFNFENNVYAIPLIN